MSADLTRDRSQFCVTIPHNSQRNIRALALANESRFLAEPAARLAFHTVSQYARYGEEAEERGGAGGREREMERESRGN